MGSVIAEFERHLSEVGARHAGRPEAELLELALLSLDGEAIVSVAYRDDVIRQRLERTPLPEDVRDVVRRALTWAWKDEEMHAIYIRGALVKLGSVRLRALAVARQFAGGLGGWAASIRQHVRLRDAPLARTVATVVPGWACFPAACRATCGATSCTSVVAGRFVRPTPLSLSGEASAGRQREPPLRAANARVAAAWAMRRAPRV